MPANIVVPEVGESIVDARIAKWLRKEGDAVSAGDPLVELETDKIDLEVGAPQSGVLSRIDRRDGEDVKVGEVLGVIEERTATSADADKDDKVETPARAPEGEAEGRAETPARAPEADGGAEHGRAASRVAPAPAAASEARQRATPAAKKAAERNDVDLSRVQGTGDGGRVMRRDVEKAAAAPAAAGPTPAAGPARPAAPPEAEPEPAAPPVPPSAARPSAPTGEITVQPGERREERTRMSKRRATIARRLVEAQSTAAMLSTFNEVDMSAVMALRERHKGAFREKHGIGLGIASFFVKASIGALRAFPRLNAEVQGDEMVLKQYYDIGVAVGASEGLVVPVLRDADRMGFAAIERQIRDFAKRAEDGTLSLADLKGGTFTITNGGVFGSLLSTPILNPPQVGILGLHKIQDRPVAVGGEVQIRPMMYVALTYDHRIVDGAEAVRFLVRMKELVEDPGALLLE